MKLRFKILFLCLGSTLLALILQTFLFQSSSSQFIYNQSKAESENSLQNMQNEIYTFVKGIESSLIEIYSERDFIQALKNGDSVEELRAEFYRKAYEIGNTKFETKDGVVALYLYTTDHEIISTYRRAVTPKHNYATDIYENPEEENAGKVLEYIASDESVMLISSYYNPYREKDILRFVLKLYKNSNRGHQIGYVVCDVDSKVFISIMEKYYTNHMMYIWLQPSGDRPAASLGELSKEEEGYYQEMSIRVMKEDPADEVDFAEQEVFQVKQNKYNLMAYSIMPQSVLEQNQKTLTRNLLLIAGLMVAIASVLTTVVSRNVIRPLDLLMETIQRIKGGETSMRTEIVGNDEIGQLGQNFNEMLDQMEELREKENQANLLLVQAQYKALQAQINPHFLYNTLDTMSSIAEIRDCPEVSMLSQSLSNIFRYSLNMKEPFSTVAKEISHLKNYTYVMAVRMQDHVKYIYDVNGETLQIPIPRISIQPLVENALNHGLRNKRGGKEIHITIKKKVGIKEKQDILEICVADNGVGMDAGPMNQALERNALQRVEQGNSIGLFNINARIKMLYGEEYGISIKSVEGEGTSVYVRLPVRQGEKKDE